MSYFNRIQDNSCINKIMVKITIYSWNSIRENTITWWSICILYNFFGKCYFRKTFDILGFFKLVKMFPKVLPENYLLYLVSSTTGSLWCNHRILNTTGLLQVRYAYTISSYIFSCNFNSTLTSFIDKRIAQDNFIVHANSTPYLWPTTLFQATRK